LRDGEIFVRQKLKVCIKSVICHTLHTCSLHAQSLHYTVQTNAVYNIACVLSWGVQVTGACATDGITVEICWLIKTSRVIASKMCSTVDKWYVSEHLLLMPSNCWSKAPSLSFLSFYYIDMCVLCETDSTCINMGILAVIFTFIRHMKRSSYFLQRCWLKLI